MSIVLYRRQNGDGSGCLYKLDNVTLEMLLTKSIPELEFEYYQMCNRQYDILIKKDKTEADVILALKLLESRIALEEAVSVKYEEQRIDQIRTEFEEEFPIDHLHECFICYESIQHHDMKVATPCCWKVTCYKCLFNGLYEVNVCPLCRAPFPEMRDKKKHYIIERNNPHLLKENTIAMFEYAMQCKEHGDESTYLTYMKRCEELGDPWAMIQIGEKHPDYDVYKKFELYKKAAEKNHRHGQFRYGLALLNWGTMALFANEEEEAGDKETVDKAKFKDGMKWIALSGMNGHPQACMVFVMYFQKSNQPYKQKYWVRKMMQHDLSAMSCEWYADALAKVYKELHQLIPRVAFWYKMASELGGSESVTQWLESFEKDIDLICGYCSGERSDTMLRCSRCKAVKYCSKDCQKTAWGEGHKEVCNGIKKEKKMLRECRESTDDYERSHDLPLMTWSHNDPRRPLSSRM